jgi:hypothetical protein
MRYLLAALGLLAAASASGPAHAESRVFILANNADGYGIDRCLASGSACGSAAATAYCQAREFHAAASYRKVERGEVTGVIQAGGVCRGFGCEEFVAIECSR